MKSNKAQAKADRAEWRERLATGRVIVLNGSTMKSYPTKEMAEAELLVFRANQYPAAFISVGFNAR